MFTQIKFKLLGVLLGTLLVLGAAQAHALRFSFENITNNNPLDAAAGEFQLYVDVDITEDTDKVLFTFGVDDIDPYADMFIEGIYFDDENTLSGIEQLIQGHHVQFTKNEVNKVRPRNLPGGNELTPSFKAIEKFSADADAPSGGGNGIDRGEILGMVFSLNDGLNYEDLITALSLGGDDGGMRVGLKIQGFEGGGSESFVSNATPVPEPASMLLLGSGLMGLALIGRRRLKRT